MMAECTFTPHTNKSKVKRNLDEFLKSQDDHVKKIQEKKENLKQHLDKQFKESESFQPKINRQSKNKKEDTPVYDRLYHRKEK